MKWNIILGSLVLSVGLCGQGFGGGLLNKVLGHSGCDSCDEAPACGCEEEPACGCEEEEPACGCEEEPACGCDAEPSCGCASVSLCACGLLDRISEKVRCLIPTCASSCCDEAPECGCEEEEPECGCEEEEPACGCDAEPSCGCAASACGCGIGLLNKIKSLNLLNVVACCAAPSCGCDDGCDSGCDAADPGEAPEASDAAPMPPAPLVDPSAFVPSKRYHSFRVTDVNDPLAPGTRRFTPAGAVSP